MSTKNLSIKSAISFGWESFFKNAKFALGSLGILIVLNIFFSILLELTDTSSSQILTTLNFLINIVSTLVGIYFSYGILKGSLMTTKNKKPSLSILTKTTFNEFAGYVAVALLVSISVLFGLVFLIIPGIYLALRFAAAEFTYIDKNLPIFENFKESSRLTKGNKLKIFGFWIVLALFNLAGLLALVVGLIITIPASFFAIAHFYKQLTEQKS